MKNGFFKKSWATFRLANIISIIIIIIVWLLHFSIASYCLIRASFILVSLN
jgi:hypothetical protein